MKEGKQVNKFTQKLALFMYGRYGVDELYYGLFGLWIALMLINSAADSVILAGLTSVVLVWQMFRFFSKNREKRRRENEVFLRFFKPVKSWFVLQRDRIRDRKTARYRKCPKCGAILKLPNKKGKHTTVCPKCSNRFDVRI